MRKGDTRTAVEKAADRFAEAKLSGRRFTLTGAWAGAVWICNCGGRLNHGDKPMCYRCELRRPGMRHWMAQSVRWGKIANDEHIEAAREYLRRALFFGVFHGGVDAAGFQALLEQVATDYRVPIEVLR